MTTFLDTSHIVAQIEDSLLYVRVLMVEQVGCYCLDETTEELWSV